MKTSILATTLGLALISAKPFAHAPLKDEAIAPASWTGFYAGLNLGFLQHEMNITDIQASSFNATIQQSQNPDFTGGFQLGYRRQLDLSLLSGVVGLEFSANFADSKYSKDYGSPYALYELRAHNSLKNALLLEGIGGIAASQTLLFLAVGAAWTTVDGGVVNLYGLPFFNGFNPGKHTFSPAVGGGIEYAFNKKVSARFKVDVILPEVYSTVNNAGNPYQISNNIVQGTFAVNYQFG